MVETLDDIEFETRTVGLLVLTMPVPHRLGLVKIVDGVCLITEQVDMGYGVEAEVATQSRLTEPQAFYDAPGFFALALQRDFFSSFSSCHCPWPMNRCIA